MPFRGDVGVLIEIEIRENGVPLNVASATTKEILIHAPGGRVSRKAASLSTDGTDGKIRYTTAQDDLGQTGIYAVQPYVVVGARKLHGEIGQFAVLPSID